MSPFTARLSRPLAFKFLAVRPATRPTARLLALLAALQTLSPTGAHAEYRVYELVIADSESGRSRTVQSTLDDIQYRGYHPLRKSEGVTLQATWMCWGSQGESKPLCPNPRPTSSSTP